MTSSVAASGAYSLALSDIYSGMYMQNDPVSLASDVFDREEDKKKLIHRCICVTIWFCISVVMAVAIPSIGRVIKILGCLSAVFTFVLPGLCLSITTLRSDQHLLHKRNVALFIIGCIFVAVGVIVFVILCVLEITRLANGK